MAIFYQQVVDEHTKLGIWKIEEEESFFNVPLQRDIIHPNKRLQHLAGRYLLKYLFPEFPLQLIKIADTKKPFLEDEAFHFSISHCGSFAAAIVSKKNRVGIDIEIPDKKVWRIKEKFLNENELSLLMRSYEEPGDFKGLEAATVLWSSKESIFKWWSYGKVDFSEMILLNQMPKGDIGIIASTFKNEKATWEINVHYRLFTILCLSWVATSE